MSKTAVCFGSYKGTNETAVLKEGRLSEVFTEVEGMAEVITSGELL